MYNFTSAFPSHPITKIFELSFRLRNFFILTLLQIPIKAMTPGAAHSPPIIEVLLNFLSFNPATVLAIFLSEIETQQLAVFF